jgi:hypothetical protein
LASQLGGRAVDKLFVDETQLLSESLVPAAPPTVSARLHGRAILAVRPPSAVPCVAVIAGGCPRHPPSGHLIVRLEHHRSERVERRLCGLLFSRAWLREKTSPTTLAAGRGGEDAFVRCLECRVVETCPWRSAADRFVTNPLAVNLSGFSG